MNENFLEIVNRILTDTDDEPVVTIEGDNLLPHTVKVKEWVNDGYDYCFKKIFQTTCFKEDGYFSLGGSSNADATEPEILRPLEELTQYDNIICDGEELTFLPFNEFNRKIFKDFGKPQFYTVYKGTVRFKPVPLSRYDVYYCGTKILEPLEKDTDIPFVNSKLLVAYGIHKQYSLDYNGTDMNSLMIFDELLKTEITALSNTQLFQQKLPEIGYQGRYAYEQE